MAFAHLAGTTTPGAPDEIIDWFATFQAWVVSMGWIVVSGGGTTNLMIRSLGEAGGLTMLYVHIWRGAGGTINRVYVEVCDDGVPTHTTNEGGYVDSGGVQFAFWMSADKDAIAIVWKVGAGYRFVYGGLTMPFALTITDETYCMIACSTIETASILRRHDGLWDQDDSLYYNTRMSLARKSVDDGSLPVAGVYFADYADIAGQLKHVTCELTDPTVNPEDTLTTGWAGASTTWVILRDNLANKFAMRTGGVLPTGRADGSFAYSTGVPATVDAWFATLVAFMTGIGWTHTNLTPVTGLLQDSEFHSTGEDGTDDIWIHIYCEAGAGGMVMLKVADSAYGTPGRHETFGMATISRADFPTQHYMCADKDCLLYTHNDGGQYPALWAGRLSVFAPNLSSPYMRVATQRVSTGIIGDAYAVFGRLLLGHDGTWCDGGGKPRTYILAYGDAAGQNSNPNNYDGVTYLVWPLVAYNYDKTTEVIGSPKYLFATDGGGVAVLDTITVAGRTYTVFFDVVSWAMRTA